MLKKIIGATCLMMAFTFTCFAAEQPKLDGPVDEATIQGYIPLWTSGNETLYADPLYIRYGKPKDFNHKNCTICAVSTLLTEEGKDVAKGNLCVYDLNCVTKKTFYEKIVDVKKNKKISEENFKNPPAVKGSPNSPIAIEVQKLKDIQLVQTFNNEMRYAQ